MAWQLYSEEDLLVQLALLQLHFPFWFLTGFVQLDEDAVVDLPQTVQLEDLLDLGGHLVDTTDLHDEGKLGSSRDIVVTLLPSLTPHPDHKGPQDRKKRICRVTGIATQSELGSTAVLGSFVDEHLHGCVDHSQQLVVGDLPPGASLTAILEAPQRTL